MTEASGGFVFNRGADPGATFLPDGRCRFRVWAPHAERVEVRLGDRIEPLAPEENGYHEAVLAGVPAGTRYVYRLDGSLERPDPASRFQPDGVHAPSAVVDPRAFAWTDAAWRGRPLREFVLYELHVGTFTPEGTFDAVIPHLDGLARLGVTSIELLPVAQCPGRRNWGYDGAYTWAVQNSYGGPDGLRRLVDACHARGLAVTLDVVYNHLGPEGNYLGAFGPYFSDQYRTAWGESINFDGPDSDGVRDYFLRNALHWMNDYHVDAFRLDAIQGIFDRSARPFLAELTDAVRRRAAELGRPVPVIAESDLNDARVVTPEAEGGLGHDAEWNDDLHHALHAYLTGERFGYYADFGGIAEVRKAYAENQVISGGYSRYRRRRHGNPARHLAPERFVVCAQNHDQTGNRMLGERLSVLVPFEQQKLLAGAVCLSPFLPMLFMGEEYGETAPFRYFVDHGDPGLVEAVRQGRARDFAAFGWTGDVPDPQDPATFRVSQLDHGLKREGRHAVLLALHTDILAFRRKHDDLFPAASPGDVTVIEGDSDTVFAVRIGGGGKSVCVAMNFGSAAAPLPLPAASGRWRTRIYSAEERRGGPAAPLPDLLEAGETAGSGSASLAPYSFAALESEGDGASGGPGSAKGTRS